MKKLEIINLCAGISGKEIIRDVNLTVRPGEVHVIMGPNGSGKSTLANALIGRSDIVCRGQIMLDGKEITALLPDQRARAGLFLSFQSPVAIPGVSVMSVIREAVRAGSLKAAKSKRNLPANPVFRPYAFMGFGDLTRKIAKEAEKLGIKKELLSRGVNDGFSGGEKKKIEMLQALILFPKYAIFDEIDTGLDVDALKIVAQGILTLAKHKTGVIVITHNVRITRFLPLNYVHIFIGGKIIKSGSGKLLDEIEKSGYRQFSL